MLEGKNGIYLIICIFEQHPLKADVEQLHTVVLQFSESACGERAAIFPPCDQCYDTQWLFFTKQVLELEQTMERPWSRSCNFGLVSL